MRSGEIRIEEWFEHPRERVFAAWTSSSGIAAWFAVPPWRMMSARFDPTEGEAWWAEFQDPTGATYREEGVFGEVAAPEQLTFTLRQRGLGNPSPVTRITVTFDEDDGGTRIRFVQTGFDDESHRAGNAEGWRQCFALLRASLAGSS